MSQPYIVAPLDTHTHDRAAFTCGVPALDRYLKEQATQDAHKHIAVTYVLCTPNSPVIIGYYALSTMSVETTRLPVTMTRRLPRYAALPAMRIGRLAVALPYRGQRFGERLLVSALTTCFNLAERIGAMAVLVDAKDEAGCAFYERY